MNLVHRSYRKELLDEENIPFTDIKRNMQELNTINSLLGGHAITLKGFIALIGNRKKITVCEMGCGGGDNLAAITKWCNRNGIDILCIGIDLKKECIQVAQEQLLLKGKAIWIINDYAETKLDTQPDILFSSLFCHHFTDESLIAQLQWMKANARIGFFHQ
jgi:2-polyprenyl-3-methyl-5-hydroxy-6-metoxy-1,4-benzoquinol methylase